MTSEPPSKYLDEKNRWEHNAAFYNREVTSPFYKILLNKKIEVYDGNSFANGIVVDIGSGNGHFLREMQAKAPFTAVNIDYSLSMLRSAKAAPSGSRMVFLAGAAEKLPLQSNSADVIVYNGALHHFKSMDLLPAAIAECNRVLRPQGKVCIYDRNGSMLSRLFHKTAIHVKRLLERCLGPLSSSSSDCEPDFNDGDLRLFLMQGFTIVHRTYVSSIPFFLLLVLCNAIEYTLGWKAAHILRHALRPFAAFFETTLQARWCTIEQCLVLRKG